MLPLVRFFDKGLERAFPARLHSQALVLLARIDTYDESRQSVIFVFNREAAEKFEKLAEANIGKRRMVVFNDKILTAPLSVT